MLKVIAISAWKGGGKDTVANYLIEKHGAARVSFADPLKDMVAKEFGISRESLDLHSLKEQPIFSMPVDPQDAFSMNLVSFMFGEFRHYDGTKPKVSSLAHATQDFLQSYVFKFGKLFWTPRALAILKGSSNRAVRSDFWVAQAIDLAKTKGGLVVISDLRYKSELDQMREAFGQDLTTVRIQRHDTSPSTDPSERDLDYAAFDSYIVNKSSLEDLYAATEYLLKQVLK